MGQANSKLFEGVNGIHKTHSEHTVIPREATITLDERIPRHCQREVLAT